MKKVTGEMPVTFGETAVALAEQGWRPIPLVTATKQPAEQGWPRFNSTPWPAAELDQAVIYHHDAACGIALPLANIALDLDIVDEEAAAEVAALADKHLGITPLVRIGQKPKQVRLYRSGGDIKSSKPHPIEIFCGSGQVAAFGWHKKAGRPYNWPDAMPIDMAADSKELPLVTDADISAFIRTAAPVMAHLRRSKGIGGAGIGRDAGDRLYELTARGVSFRDASKLVLAGATGGGRHYAVRAVVSAGYNAGYDGDYLEQLICRHAPADLRDYVIEDGYLDRVLDAFMPRQTSMAWRADNKNGGE